MVVLKKGESYNGISRAKKKKRKRFHKIESRGVISPTSFFREHPMWNFYRSQYSSDAHSPLYL